MKKILLFIVNILLFISVSFQVVSAMFDVLKDDDFLMKIHGLNGFILAGLIILHLILNWSWIKINVLRIKK